MNGHGYTRHGHPCGRWLGMAQAAARSEGYTQARAEDIAALLDRDRYEAWWAANATTRLETDNGSSRNVPWMLSLREAEGAADYLASLTPTQEAPE